MRNQHGTSRDLRSEAGEIGSLVMLLIVFVMFVGVAYDGGKMFQARRAAENIANSSARFGATSIDENAFLWNNEIRLSGDSEGLAVEWATRRGADTVSAARRNASGYRAPTGFAGGSFVHDTEILVVDVSIVVDDFVFIGNFLPPQTVTGSGWARPTHPEESPWR